METVHVRINELLAEKAKREGRTTSITQEELSNAIGIPQGTISRWASNKVDRLDKNIMLKLCRYFECEIGDLLVRVNL